MITPADPVEVERLANLGTPEEAVIRAWLDSGTHPIWHQEAVYQVRLGMPVLAAAIERLVEAHCGEEPSETTIQTLTKENRKLRDRLEHILMAHISEEVYDGATPDEDRLTHPYKCMECNQLSPCPTFQMATGELRWLSLPDKVV